jgi:hypothetical protein
MLLLRRILHAISSCGCISNSAISEPVVIPVVSPDTKYIEHHTKKLVASFSPEHDQSNANANTDAEFYERDGFSKCTPQRLDERLISRKPDDIFDSYIGTRHADLSGSSSQAANIICDAWTIEKKWKSRILLASTPRGNVYMHYDIYKGAFAYYSDTNLPYLIANAVAARYVIVFACRDLFLDESVLGRRSPLSWGPDPEKPVAVSDAGAELRPKLRPLDPLLPSPPSKPSSPKPSLAEESVFVTLKKFSGPLSKEDFPLEKNKFVYMGRVRDVKFLQLPPPPIVSITPHNTRINAPDRTLNKKNLTYDEYIEYRKHALATFS